MTFRSFLVSCSFCALSIASRPVAALPAIALGERSVSIQELTPNGRAVVFSIGRPLSAFMPVTARLDVMLDADGAGNAMFDLPSPVAERSVWGVVDVESGELALAAPEGFELRQVELPGNGIGQTRRFLLSERRFLEVMLVRPLSAVPGGNRHGTRPRASTTSQRTVASTTSTPRSTPARRPRRPPRATPATAATCGSCSPSRSATVATGWRSSNRPTVPGAASMAGAKVGLGTSLGTSVIHELGHVKAYFNGGIRPGLSEAEAVHYENLHRKLLIVPKNTQRELP